MHAMHMTRVRLTLELDYKSAHNSRIIQTIAMAIPFDDPFPCLAYAASDPSSTSADQGVDDFDFDARSLGRFDARSLSSLPNLDLPSGLVDYALNARRRRGGEVTSQERSPQVTSDWPCSAQESVIPYLGDLYLQHTGTWNLTCYTCAELPRPRFLLPSMGQRQVGLPALARDTQRDPPRVGS